MTTPHQTVLRSTAHTRALETREHLATAGKALLGGNTGDAMKAVEDANRSNEAALERLHAMMEREPQPPLSGATQ